jgi:hypothetical protein
MVCLPKDLHGQGTLGSWFKPRGCLWLSCGDAWLKWLSDEQMASMLKSYRFVWTVEVDTERLVCLMTKRDIKHFHKRFGVVAHESYAIDWDRVRRETGKSGVYVHDASITLAAPEKTTILWCLGSFAFDGAFSFHGLAQTFLTLALGGFGGGEGGGRGGWLEGKGTGGVLLD